MIPPAIPPDEATRLVALRSLGILDTPPEERFDRLTRLACRAFDVPIAIISLVDGNRQWFKSRQGVDLAETAREISFCGHGIVGDGLFLVPDAAGDERFRDTPMVTGAPHIRFYAGAPDHLVLVIDPARLTEPVLEEQGADVDDRFPHLYGPLPVEAVVAVHRLEEALGGLIP